jgi:hypothetical protein
MVLFVLGFSLLGVVMVATAVVATAIVLLKRRGSRLPDHLDRLYVRFTLVAYPVGSILAIIGDLTR